MKFTLVLDGKILRKRAHTINKNGFIFDPDSKYKIELSDYLYENKLYPETPFQEGLKVTYECYFKLPKSLTKKESEERLQRGWAYEVRKDCDNIAKIYNDIFQYGMLEGKYFKDDHFIVELVVKKLYSDKDEFIIVTFEEV